MSLTLQDYQRKKRERLAAQLPPRELCYACWRPRGFCYCGKIVKMSFDIRFAILIHPLEEKRPIATGRMAHLCLENSELIEGDDYSDDERVNTLIADPQYAPVILYPGADAADLDAMPPSERRSIFAAGKKPLILVIDGTWNSARRTMNQSRNLKSVPKIRFTPATPSRIRVRHQPEAHCYTTIEAIHQVIDLFAAQGPHAASSRPHDNLLEVLDHMVSLQLRYGGEGKKRDEGPRARKFLG